jgi:hypothetical protein
VATVPLEQKGELDQTVLTATGTTGAEIPEQMVLTAKRSRSNKRRDWNKWYYGINGATLSKRRLDPVLTSIGATGAEVENRNKRNTE